MRAAAVVVAAGRGERLGARKQFVLLDGLPLVLWSVRALLTHAKIELVVVVLPPEEAHAPPEWLRMDRVTACPGGATRRESAGLGVAAVPLWADVILIHDAARPFVTDRTIDAVLREAEKTGGALPILPMTDTVKLLSAGRVTGTMERSELGRAQTPQGFRAELIREAHAAAAAAEVEAADDATLLESLGSPVAATPGDPFNLKITTPADLEMAEWLVRSGRVPKRSTPRD